MYNLTLNISKMKKITIYLLSFVTVVSLSLISCGGGETEEEQTTDSVQVEETTPDTPVELDLSAGELIYKEKCLVCHMETGLGVDGVFPPLAKSDYLLEDKMRAVKQTMYGSNDPITVNDREYPGNQMTKDLNLTDEETKAVVDYILNSWGNKGGTVTIEEVKAAREK